jgi:hypothetical protein
LEKSPTTEREHFQGYCVFESPIRLRQAQHILSSPTLHLEVRRGTHAQARDYCSKVETRVAGPFEFGTEPPGPGTRTDLLTIQAQLDSGATELSIAKGEFSLWCRNYKALSRYRNLQAVNLPIIGPEKVVQVFYGPTGVGKTHRACTEALQLANNDNSKIYILSQSSANITYWDGYDLQPYVVIDEFPFPGYSLSVLLRLLDRYSFMVNQRGSSASFVATHIWITTNIHPAQWYPEQNLQTAALMRRIKLIEFPNVPYIPQVSANPDPLISNDPPPLENGILVPESPLQEVQDTLFDAEKMLADMFDFNERQHRQQEIDRNNLFNPSVQVSESPRKSPEFVDLDYDDFDVFPPLPQETSRR